MVGARKTYRGESCQKYHGLETYSGQRSAHEVGNKPTTRNFDHEGACCPILALWGRAAWVGSLRPLRPAPLSVIPHGLPPEVGLLS